MERINKKLVIKVCGMKSPANRQALEELPVDIFGFIFYPPSPRHVGDLGHEELALLTSSSKMKTGVFVNTPPYIICEIARKYGLDLIQLHGGESPETCREIKASGLKVIKAFPLGEGFDFSEVAPYTEVADFFLFDTKSGNHGGNGLKFNWNNLVNYLLETPFFLSGGINAEDEDTIRHLSHPAFIGIDLNSGFEDAPGIKNQEKLKIFLEKVLL